jgi:hypothetical protein
MRQRGFAPGQSGMSKAIRQVYPIVLGMQPLSQKGIIASLKNRALA